MLKKHVKENIKQIDTDLVLSELKKEIIRLKIDKF